MYDIRKRKVKIFEGSVSKVEKELSDWLYDMRQQYDNDEIEQISQSSTIVPVGTHGSYETYIVLTCVLKFEVEPI